MTITNLELAEMLIAFGNAMKAVTTNNEVPNETKKEMATFDFDVSTTGDNSNSEPPAADDSSKTTGSFDTSDSQVDPLAQAAEKIKALEDELIKVKGQSSMLGLQPIKVTTPVTTEVK